jgi:sugar lactone lactonase YvrE
VHQVFAFSTTGQLLGQYPKDPAVSATWSDGDPQYPVADAQGNVYLTEIYPGNLDKFSPDGSQKSVIWTYGAPGPLGLALDPTGDIYVGLARDDIVVEISPAGKEIARSGFADNGQGQTTVRGLAIDSHGNIYASVDGGGGCNPGDQITEFSPDLKSQHAVATAGTGPGQVCAPQGLAVDTQDNLYVPDLFNNRVQKFSPSGKLLATFTGD